MDPLLPRSRDEFVDRSRFRGEDPMVFEYRKVVFGVLVLAALALWQLNDGPPRFLSFPVLGLGLVVARSVRLATWVQVRLNRRALLRPSRSVPLCALPAWVVLEQSSSRQVRSLLAPLSDAERDCVLGLAAEFDGTVGELVEAARLLVLPSERPPT